MENEENKIIFKEIKTYEDAYYYNSDPNYRIEYNNKEHKPEKKKFKFRDIALDGIGEIVGGAIELVFSLLD